MEHWIGRRSAVYGLKGICASSQSLASSVGIQILDRGGSAADAAVAMAAALNVTEPCSTGIGGDAFALYYEASTKKVHCLSGNGASAEAFTLEKLNSMGIGVGPGMKPLDPHSALCVTVPGAAMLWDDLVRKFGSLTLWDVLQPAINLAENGFPVHPVTAEAWSKGFLQGEEAFRVFRPNNERIHAGQIMKNKDLAETFRTVGKLGAKEGFYSGRIAEAIISTVQGGGGLLTAADLAAHETCWEAPISTVYKGIRIYQTPPPSHGLAVLLALNILQNIDADTESTPSLTPPLLPFTNHRLDDRNSIDNIHLSIESTRRAFADALHYIGDPRHRDIPVELLLSPDYLKGRAAEIDRNNATAVYPGQLDTEEMIAYNETMSAYLSGETVYFCVVDSAGNACSFINSNYQHFGTGLVPPGTGFTLQNRGFNFSLVPGHMNCAAGRKRPYHTIIPGLATFAADESLYAVFGNMGGFMQPMGHVQLLRSLIDYGLDPQVAIDAPRWFLSCAGRSQSAADLVASTVQLEAGSGMEAVRQQLIERGHHVEGTGSAALVSGAQRSLFGKAQAILRDPITGRVVGGSDPRGDGAVMAQV